MASVKVYMGRTACDHHTSSGTEHNWCIMSADQSRTRFARKELDIQIFLCQWAGFHNPGMCLNMSEQWLALVDKKGSIFLLHTVLLVNSFGNYAIYLNT